MYGELRRLAAQRLASLPVGQTLQATALVHEAYLRLDADGGKRWQGRRHFFAAAAEAMRHILIDRVRRRSRLKHGGGAARVDFDRVEVATPAKDEVLLRLDEALDDLQAVSPERAEVVTLRFFAGFSEAEVAEALGMSERSVQRQWAYAKAWLFERVRAAE